MRVLLTRPGEQNEGLAEKLTATGIAVVVCPAIEIHTVMTSAELMAAWTEWRRTDRDGELLVVLTSATTIGLLTDAGVTIDCPVAAIGPATARAARMEGWTVLPLVAKDGQTLLASLKAYRATEQQHIWLPQSGAAASDLADGLMELSASVTVIPAYEPVPCTDALRTCLVEMGPFDAVVLYSGSAAAALADAGDAFDAPVVCIGESTRAVCDARGMRVVAVAKRPDEDAVIAALEKARMIAHHAQ